MSSTAFTPAPPGPEFYCSLLPLPELDAVLRAARCGDTAGALTAYARYLRRKRWNQRLLQVLPVLEPGGELHPEGEAIAARRITQIGRTVEFGAEIDWRYAPADLPDYPLMLNRHYHWVALAEAFRATGNPVYIRSFIGQFVSWLAAMPPPDGELLEEGRRIDRARGHRRPFAPGWRTIEVGERLRDTWPKVLGTFLMQTEFSDEALVAGVASMVGQAEFLVEFEGPYNWMYIESEGLVRAAGLFPEFARAEIWIQTALGRVEASSVGEIYPSGAHEELTFWYQNVVRGAIAGVVDMAAAQGVEASAALQKRLEGLYESMSMTVQPDGLLPQVNDGDRLPAIDILREGSARFQRQDFLYTATCGAGGKRPAFTSISLPEPGWAVMRSDWSPDAGYAFFDAGPFGGHAHEDKLSLILHAHGAPFIIDTGRSAYGEHAWRRFNIGPKAHSTVLFDGAGQCRRWWPGSLTQRSGGPVADGFAFKTDPQVDVATGVFGSLPFELFYSPGTGFRFVQHRRTLVFLKPDRWVVIDRFCGRERCSGLSEAELEGCPQAPCSATALFQLADHPYELHAASSTLYSRAMDGPCMTVAWTGEQPLAARVVRGQSEPEILGWQFADMADGHRPGAIPVLILDTALPQLPLTQAYLFSVAPTAETCRRESLQLECTSTGYSLELVAQERILARLEWRSRCGMDYNAAYAGGPMQLRVDWSGRCHDFTVS